MKQSDMADSSMPMKASDKLRSDVPLIQDEWKKKRMLDIADEVAKLEAKLEKVKQQAADYLNAGAKDALKLLDVIKENEALQDYAKHKYMCVVDDMGGVCSCGLDALLPAPSDTPISDIPVSP